MHYNGAEFRMIDLTVPEKPMGGGVTTRSEIAGLKTSEWITCLHVIPTGNLFSMTEPILNIVYFDSHQGTADGRKRPTTTDGRRPPTRRPRTPTGAADGKRRPTTQDKTCSSPRIN